MTGIDYGYWRGWYAAGEAWSVGSRALIDNGRAEVVSVQFLPEKKRKSLEPIVPGMVITEGPKKRVSGKVLETA